MRGTRSGDSTSPRRGPVNEHPPRYLAGRPASSTRNRGGRMQACIAGLDLASEEHRLVVVDGDGREREQRRVAHTEDGIETLIRRLRELQVSRVAIEQPNGLVVDRLLDAGVGVVAVHPNQLAAARDRYRAGGGKSDGFDGYVLAELARTDMHRMRLP